jgi:aryl carrier-like protein
MATLVDAEKLLDKVEALLLLTLSRRGQNTIRGEETLTKPSARLPSEKSTRKEQATSTTATDFSWTEPARLMRSEISALARMPEDAIRESSSIFELGLDSIDVIKLSSRLKKQDIEIPVSTIIKCQTIAQMMPRLVKNGLPNDTARNPKKTVQIFTHALFDTLKKNGKLPSGTAEVLPATPLQQTMVNEMVRSGYKRYFNVEVFKLDETTDQKRLKAAIEEVVAASPILRTSFIEVDDPSVPVSFAQIISKDSPRLEEVAEDQDLETFVDQFEARSAEVAASRGTLFQAVFLKAQKSRYMVISISHALYDGKSLQLIHQDICRAYNGEFHRRLEYNSYLEEVFNSTTEDAKSFWKSTLSSLPSTSFPTQESSGTPTNIPSRLEIRSRIALQEVEQFCKSLRITLQTLGQTCWAIVLSQLMRQLDVVFGTVLSCRDSEESNEIMFPLMNTVVVRSVIHGSFSEMLKYMQDMSDSTRQYQHFPLGTAQAYALASRKDSLSKDTKLFDTLFIYQGRQEPSPAMQTLYQPVYGSAEVEFPVCVEMEIIDGSIIWTTACKPTARNPAEAKELLEMLDNAIEHILNNPDAAAIVSDAEGISVGGLSKFQKQLDLPKKSATSPTQQSDNKWSYTELSIRNALFKVSGVPAEGIHKDLTIFHLGLDSILALKLPALLKTSGIKLKVSDILKHQTIRAMAVSVDNETTDRLASVDVDSVLTKAVSSLDIESEVRRLTKTVGEIDYIMPVTAGQLYMIRMWQISRGVLFYPTFTYNLPGKPDKAKIQTIWKELMRRHDILRTSFVDINSHMVQVVFKNPVNSTSTNTEPLKQSSKLQIPSLSLVVEEVGVKSCTLKLHIHHALYDGVSLPVLFGQLNSLYHGQQVDRPNMSFKALVAQSIAASDHSKYGSSTWEKWQSYLSQESLYPSQNIHAPDSSVFERRTEVYQKGRKTSPLKGLAKESGVSIDSLLIAATAQLLAQSLQANSVSPISQVALGVYLANRAPFGEDLSLLIAPTLNILPLCVKEPLGRPVPELAVEIQRDLHEISSDEMFSASLADIYKWTGVRVNFFVNIHKDAVSEISETSGILGASPDIPSKADVVEASLDGDLVLLSDGRYDAYLVSLRFMTPQYNGQH